MIKRNLLQHLRRWRNKKDHKPLILRGARQVGKTTLVKEFGKEFDTFISLNLERKSDAQAFALADNVKEVFEFICLQRQLSINTNSSTLLFFDEIQEVPKAVAMLRYFYEDLPWLYVISAGSRLQSLINQHISFPVGRVEYMMLHPCSFIEFLDAMGYEQYIEKINNLNVSPLLHQPLMKLFNRYALLGGMPQVLDQYAQSNDITSIAPVYSSLLNGYTDDIEKMSDNARLIAILRHILLYGWQFSGQIIKFKGFAGSTYSSRDIHEAMVVLQRAFLLNLVYPTTNVEAPAIPALRRSPKLFWFDNGIVNFSAGIQNEYLTHTDLLAMWRGNSAEQIVAQELSILLTDKLHPGELQFWVRDKAGTTAEVDFVWQNSVKLIPIEVKTGTNAHLRSLQSFMATDGAPDIAIRIWSGQLRHDLLRSRAGKPFLLISLPFYYISQLENVIANVPLHSIQK